MRDYLNRLGRMNGTGRNSFLNRVEAMERRFGHTSGILALLLPWTLSAVAQAQFNYITNNGTITITGFNSFPGPGSAVTVPSTINGLPVTSIGHAAFYGASLDSVTIATSVTSIGEYAFYDCASLTNVTIPNGVTSIADYAFTWCASLTNVTIPKSVTRIGNGAFGACSGLSALTVDQLNSAYSSVAGVLFDKSQTTLIQCPGAEAGTYIIPSSVTSIAGEAFYACASLTSVTIPHSATSIAEHAFLDCASLTNVLIPSGVTNIGDGPFAACTSLSAITVDPLNSAYSSMAGVLFNKSQTTLIQCPAGRIGTYTIPNGVTRIGNWAFTGCTSVTNFTIPNSVADIGNYAFYDCASLTDLMIANSVTSIGDAPFAACASLSAITVDPLNPAYRSAAGVLFNKSQTTLIQCPGGKAGTYTVPNGVTSIGDDAFHACVSLINVAIPNSVTNIGYSVFARCTSLTNVTIPNSVTSIGEEAFVECANLTGVYFLGDCPTIGSRTFFGTSQATLYYLPGTMGWGPTFGGRPTVLWNASIQAGGPGFGVQPGGFGFTITGTTDIPIVVEARPSLANASWISLLNCTLTNGSVHFSDSAWVGYPTRFYRLRSP